MRIDFYPLKTKSLDYVLPRLLEKVYASKERALIKTDSAELTDYINNLLWSYDADKWLPHGTKKEVNSDKQPIFISDDFDNPNQATILVLLNGEDIDLEVMAKENKYSRILSVFSSSSMGDVEVSRKLWKQAEALGLEKNSWNM